MFSLKTFSLSEMRLHFSLCKKVVLFFDQNHDISDPIFQGWVRRWNEKKILFLILERPNSENLFWNQSWSSLTEWSKPNLAKRSCVTFLISSLTRFSFCLLTFSNQSFTFSIKNAWCSLPLFTIHFQNPFSFSDSDDANRKVRFAKN